jgi:hypothetical protein
MKIRFLAAVLAAALPIAFVACSNKQESKTGAVFIESTWQDICSSWDVQPGSGPVFIETTTFKSVLKKPADATTFLDVELTDQYVYFKRVDGGREVPKMTHFAYHVLVPAGGSATLSNGRIIPPEDLLLPPFDRLYPENGGVDPDTGSSVIQIAAKIRWYGHTYSGDDLSTEFNMPLLFRYGSGCNSPASAAR